MSRSLVVVSLAASLLSLPIASCNYGPQAVRPPYIDPSDAAEQAMEMYDTDGDGRVAGAELDEAPGLKAALPRMDTNQDDAITGDEVAERVGGWQKGLGLMSFVFKVTLDGVPLDGALVTFEPEKFLGDEFKSASCTTSSYGDAGATIAKEDRPSPKTPPGMQLGVYKVKISKTVGGKETIPAKYNENTILGQEVSMDVSEIANNRVVYALTSK
jgi:hypothetical protein